MFARIEGQIRQWSQKAKQDWLFLGDIRLAAWSSWDSWTREAKQWQDFQSYWNVPTLDAAEKANAALDLEVVMILSLSLSFRLHDA